MKRLSAFIFLVFLTQFLFAQKTTCTVYGLAPGREGHVIGAYIYDDYITHTELKLAEGIVGDSGKFSLEVEVTGVTYIFLRCNKVHGFLYAEPGRKVELVFPERDYKAQVNPDVDYVVPMMVYISDSTDMNFLADDYNIKFDKFWRKNFEYFARKDSLIVLDTFHMQMNRHYVNVKNPYFLPWMNYGLASMEDGIFQSQKRTGFKYVLNKPIYYHNSEYMEFFNNFFQNYMYKWSARKEGAQMLYAVNNLISYDSLLSSMKRLPWVENDTLRELVMLKGLFESYNNPAFNARNILAIAQQASTRSRIPEHRRIARNIISFYTKMKRGTLAPHFVGVNKLGVEIDPIEKYKGRYIYIFFFATWNTHSMSEFRYMEELQKKYGKQIEFVSISLDPDTNAFKAFIKANPKYKWTILHFDFNEKTKSDYNLFGVPAGFIIDPEGKLYVSPADNPSGDLEYNLYRIAFPKAAPFVKIGDR
ncbi:MAG: TlpA family protein disulfide reductase [Bacteroidota bacterium]|nr:TlpA family protein disulfide reductase [Bacteroidota bacterium]